jgi:tetratricopeptide (TPR) repeat protein
MPPNQPQHNDTPKHPVKPPVADAGTRAKSTYDKGNERLFAGDTGGAIAAYNETLQISPGYVAAYRGLGLAYSQRGDKAKALAAFEKYVSLAPNARDVPMIQSRIKLLRGN